MTPLNLQLPPGPQSLLLPQGPWMPTSPALAAPSLREEPCCRVQASMGRSPSLSPEKHPSDLQGAGGEQDGHYNVRFAGIVPREHSGHHWGHRSGERSDLCIQKPEGLAS